MSSDGVIPIVGFETIALGMDKGVVYNIVSGCTVGVLELLRWISNGRLFGVLWKEREIPARQGRVTRWYLITRNRLAR